MSNINTQSRHRRRFDQLVANMHKDMYRYAAWLSRDPIVAIEVVQKSLRKARKSPTVPCDDAAAKIWLLAVVRRENARHVKRERLIAVDIDSLTDSQSAMLAGTGDTELDKLRAAIYRLEIDYREPMVLQVMMGLGTDAIAELIGLKRQAVLARLQQARYQLRNIHPNEKIGGVHNLSQIDLEESVFSGVS